MLSKFFSRSGAGSADEPVLRVLMVCMGNICRSPTAEAVLRHKLAQAGLDDKVQVDSAGTRAFHVGSPPDVRSQKHARQRGYDLSKQRARKVQASDFAQFDLLVAMDWDNLSELEQACPDLGALQHKLRRMMEFAPPAVSRVQDVVPDPYYGGPAGFDVVLDLVEQACEGLVAHLREQVESREKSTPGVDPRL